jgi:hypothetical protein
MIIIKRLTSPGKKTYLKCGGREFTGIVNNNNKKTYITEKKKTYLKCEGREFTGIVVRYARKNDKYATRKNEKYATRKSEKYATRKKRP